MQPDDEYYPRPDRYDQGWVQMSSPSHMSEYSPVLARLLRSEGAPGPADPAMGDANSHRNPTVMVNTASWILATLAMVFLGVRIWCRLFRHKGLWWDDGLLIASLVALLVAASSHTAMLASGYGAAPFAKGLPVTFLEAAFSSASIATAWSKTAFAITLLSIAKTRTTKAFLWMAIVFLNIICYLFAIGFWSKTCESDRSQGFASAVLPGPCWSADSFTLVMYIQASFSAAMDLTLAFLPWPIIWRTQLQVPEKIGLGISMSLGVIACVVVILRIVYLEQLQSHWVDATWYTGKVCVTNIAEPCATIVAQSIPVFRTLFQGARSDERITTGTTAEPRGSSPTRRSSNQSGEDPFGFLNDDETDINLRLIKRPDGRIVLATEYDPSTEARPS
ncbi:hypothetical protein F4809DRAFT_588197 [Biscogniauxia mediterranea]|nr:hypothetical protein F4809DRAFT_588197 [Biscogniauxia mediterranea]